MQNTLHYNLKKYDAIDRGDRNVINGNMDILDTVLYENGQKTDASIANLADAYDDTGTYSVGDLRIYGNVLYKCITAIDTPEAWDAEHWEPITLAEAIARGGGGAGGAIDYSTEEQKTGAKWIDGKPLYRKTIILNNVSIGTSGDLNSTSARKEHGIANVDRVVRAEFYLDARAEPGYYDSPAQSVNLYANDTYIALVSKSTSWSARENRIWYITLEYTKTTDEVIE